MLTNGGAETWEGVCKMMGSPDPAAGNKVVGHNLEEVRVQALAVVVRPLDGPAHAGGQSLHLNPNPLTVHTPLISKESN